MPVKAKPRHDRALQKAIKVMGGLTPLAKALGVTVQAISQWERCPSATRAGQIEQATGGQVTRLMLMPHIFGPAKPQRKAHGKQA